MGIYANYLVLQAVSVRKLKELLIQQGHKVINIDLKRR